MNEGTIHGEADATKVSFQDLSIYSSTSMELSSSTVTVSGTTSVGSKLSDYQLEEKEMVSIDVELNKGGECVESGKSSLSSSSYCNSIDVNEASFRSYCPSKPHKGNDIRWDAIQSVLARDGQLGLGHFRLLKKLGFGDIGSVY